MRLLPSMQQADREGSLGKYFEPHLEPDERRKAEVEGWILGVLWPPPTTPSVARPCQLTARESMR
jgi:hypothetical protein